MSASPLPEHIEVRPDERFDTARLHGYLQGRLPGADRDLSVRQFSRGKANPKVVTETILKKLQG